MNERKGIGAVEVIIGVSIAALSVIFVGSTVASFMSRSAQNLDRVRAVYLAEEGLEITRYVRDESWSAFSSLTLDTNYYFSLSTTTATTTTTQNTTDGFTRTLTLSSVYRRTSDDDIVASTSASPKAIDSNSRLATVTVKWGTPTSTVSLSTYLTNF